MAFEGKWKVETTEGFDDYLKAIGKLSCKMSHCDSSIHSQSGSRSTLIIDHTKIPHCRPIYKGERYKYFIIRPIHILIV